jgi:diacylglycerol diphosphate phosphatase / phosphatidate phosphatase
LLAIAFRNRSHLRGAISNGDLSWVLFFITAGITTAIVTETLKNLVGRYRPDWLDRCLPAVPGTVIIDAWGATSSENPPCTNEDISASKLDDGMKSFPSGHSSTAFSLGTVVAAHAGWWMLGSGGREARPTPIMATLLELWMALQISWAIGVASSRVMDNKHHVGDVVGGGLIGVLFGALYSFRAVVESKARDTIDAIDACHQGASDSDERSILHTPG